MTRSLLLGALFCGSLALQAQELPQPSSAASVTQRIGLTDITVKYSRPSMKDRKIFGELVPLDKMWRTGANENTTIELSGPVKIEGKDVAAGTYSLFTIPGADKWTIVLNSKNDHWGTGDYEEENDVVRFDVKPGTCDKTETFTISFSDIGDGTGNLEFSWEATKVSFSIVADATDIAVSNIEAAVAKEDATFRTFNKSARFYVDHNVNAKQALEWATRSVSMDKKFWNVYTLSLCYAANGQYKDAVNTANESRDLALAADYAPYVKMNDDNLVKWKAMK